MKKRFLVMALALMLLACLLPAAALAAEEIAIDETNFPDAIFRDMLEHEVDRNGNGKLSQSEIYAVTEIFVCDAGATTIEGVENFKNLKLLAVNGNDLTQIDLTGLTKLEFLNVSGNDLEELDVSMCPNLVELYAYDNASLTKVNAGNTSIEGLYLDGLQIQELDVSGCDQLKELIINGNGMEKLDVTGCTALEVLAAEGNKLTELDLSGSTKLFGLHLNGNELLTKLNVSGCTSLKELYVHETGLTKLNVSGSGVVQLFLDGTSIQEIDIRNCTVLEFVNLSATDITELDATGCTNLKEVYAYETGLTKLNVSGTAVENLFVSGLKIEELDASNCTSLKFLDANMNSLKKLNVAGCTALEGLAVEGNKLTALDVSDCGNLKGMYVSANQLKTLDVSKCTKLEELYVPENKLSALDVTKLTELKTLVIAYNQIESLDLSKNTKLELFYGGYNNMACLDTSAAENLAEFGCVENVSDQTVSAKGTLNLTTIPGFDVDKAFNWVGATVEGNIMTVEEGTEYVTYEYDCGNGKNELFGMNLKWKALESPFTDVSVDAPYFDAVVWALENDVTAGMGGGKFGVDATCTRGQVMTFLYAAKNRPGADLTQLAKFTDVKTADYYAGPVAWAVANKVTDGMTATTFGPEVTCTRAHVVTFIWAAMGRQEPSQIYSYSDMSASDWYAPYMSWAVENGMLEPDSNGNVYGNEPCPRQDIVLYLYKFLAE